MPPQTEKLTGKQRLALFLLALSLACCVFEGAARKSALGDGSIAGRIAYLSKDMVMACFLLVGLGRETPVTKAAKPLLFLGLALLTIGACMSAAIGFEPVGVVLTVRTFFVLPLAAWVAGRLLPPDALSRLALWVATLSLPMAALGVLQFFAPSGSPLNRYSTMGETTQISTAGVSERIRATGTFSYITGMGEFATVAVWAGIVTFTLARGARARSLGYAGLAAGGCCALVTVSRAVALVSLGLIAIWALTGGKFGRKAQTALTIGAVGCAALFLTGLRDTAAEVVSTVYLRHASEVRDTFAHRLWYQWVHPLDAMGASPFGEGLGSQQVATSLGEDARRLKGVFESPWGKTIMELGAVGFIGFMATCGAVFAPLVSAYRASPKGEQRTVLAVTGAALATRAMLGFQFNHVAAYFFWAVAAALFAWQTAPPQERKTRPAAKAARRAKVAVA